MSELEGATQLPGEGERVSTPGQFAALWNGMTPEAQQGLLTGMQRSTDDALRCYLESHDDELLELRGRLTAVLTLHQPPDGDDPASTYCAHDDNPWPCPTAQAAGTRPAARAPALTPEQLAEARRVRAWVDEAVPRVLDDDSINPQHIAIEMSERERVGLPVYIADLDGPGKFRP